MRKTRKSIRGGRFLGEGSFGCTFGYPPLPCMTKDDRPLRRRPSDQISKLMHIPTANKAVVKNEMFRTIDPTQTYFISSTRADRCRPAFGTGVMRLTDELHECHLDKSKEVALMFFQMGGIDLDKITLTARDYAPFFKSLVNLFRGLELAHTNNIVHLDIKPANIVSQRPPGGEFQTRFIDYDFSVNLTKITKRTDKEFIFNTEKNGFTSATDKDVVYASGDYMFDATYVFWPFELKFMNEHTQGKCIPGVYDPLYIRQYKQQNLRNLFGEWYGSFVNNYSKALVNGTMKPFGYDGAPQIGSTLYMKDFLPYLRIDDSTYKEYLKKVDVYMLGMTLGCMINRFFDYLMICEDEATMKYQLYVHVKGGDGRKTYRHVNELEALGFSKEIQDWHVRVQDELMYHYMILVDLMTHMNISKRISIHDATHIYNGILHLFDELFTEDAITNYLLPLGCITVDAQIPLADIQVSPAPPVVRRAYQPPPTNLRKIQVSPAGAVANRPYQLPPTNIRKINTNLFSGGRRRSKTHKKRGRK